MSGHGQSQYGYDDGYAMADDTLSSMLARRSHLRLQREQIRRKQQEIEQELATSEAAMLATQSLYANGLDLSAVTNMDRTASQLKRAHDGDDDAAVSTMSRSISINPSRNATRAVARPRHSSFGNQDQHRLATSFASQPAADSLSAQLSSSFYSQPALPTQISDHFTMMSPLEYLSGDTEPSIAGYSSNKRKRTGHTSFSTAPTHSTASLRASQAASHGFRAMQHSSDTINPSILGTSFGTQPSTMSSQSAQTMSRQSSNLSGYSTVDRALGMMRLQSTTSYTQSVAGSDANVTPFTCDDLDDQHGRKNADAPAILYTAATWSSNDANITRTIADPAVGLDAPQDDLFDHIGEGFQPVDASLHIEQGNISLDTNNIVPTAMERSESNTSCSSNTSTKSAAERRANERNQRHINNSKQVIKSKAVLQPAVGPCIKSENNVNTAAAPSSTAKQAITKIPYQRPQQQRQFCTLCDKRPFGFHGPHELRRHMATAHDTKRKAWICTQPRAILSNDYWPKTALDVCKHCIGNKKYNVYYNAAEHLRRAHFYPTKRGRRPKGSTHESRADKTARNQPTIAWLKENGWLQEVDVMDDEWAKLFGEEDNLEHDETEPLSVEHGDHLAEPEQSAGALAADDLSGPEPFQFGHDMLFNETHAEFMPFEGFDSTLLQQQDMADFDPEDQAFWNAASTQAGFSFDDDAQFEEDEPTDLQ